MKKHLLSKFCFLLFVMLLPYAAFSTSHSGKLMFTARLEGSQVVPAATTKGFGVASFTFNAARDSMCINMTVANLSSAIQAVQIKKGAMGQSGEMAIDLSTYAEENRIKTVIAGSQLDSAFMSGLLQGQYYVEVQTQENPAGELRGQLMLETDIPFHAVLDTAQEAHTVTGTDEARGLGVFNISRDSTYMHVKVIGSRLTGPVTGAHFHYGTSNINGPIAIGLDSIRENNFIRGMINIAATEGFLDSLMAGKVYINLHTEQNPQGEVRGQLMHEEMLALDAYMDTAQQPQEVTESQAQGLMYAHLNYSFDTLHYRIQVDSLSGPIIMAEFRRGMPGDTGVAVKDITANVDVTTISGTIAGEELTSAIVDDFLRGNMFIVIRTFLNIEGEVRGQIYPLFREGYPFVLEGSQEVPAVTTNASGSGFVSIDRDTSNAYFSMVVTNLTGPVTVAHFHKAVRGEAGSPVFDLTSYFAKNGTSDSASGYWTMRSDPPFTKEVAMEFKQDSIYANIHTEQYPAGEVRGQVSRNFECSESVTSISPAKLVSKKALLFPNPANDLISLRFEATTNAEGWIRVYDATGREVQAQQIRVKPGGNDLLLDISRYEDGLYWLQLITPEAQYRQTFIKH
jgi:hypothetical protein